MITTGTFRKKSSENANMKISQLMSGYGLCWPIKLFSAPLRHGIMGFIFPFLCHLSIKWANLHHSSWTKKREILECVFVCEWGFYHWHMCMSWIWVPTSMCCSTCVPFCGGLICAWNRGWLIAFKDRWSQLSEVIKVRHIPPGDHSVKLDFISCGNGRC